MEEANEEASQVALADECKTAIMTFGCNYAIVFCSCASRHSVDVWPIVLQYFSGNEEERSLGDSANSCFVRFRSWFREPAVRQIIEVTASFH